MEKIGNVLKSTMQNIIISNEELKKHILNEESLKKTQQAYEKALKKEMEYEKEEKTRKLVSKLEVSGLSINDYKKAKEFKFYEFYYHSISTGKVKHSKFLIKKVREWWKEKRKEKPFLVLFGERGTGKTQLAKKIAISALFTKEERLNVYYADKKYIDKKIYDFDSKQEFLDFLSEVKFLIIDDILSGHSSEFSFAQIYSVLDYRYQQCKLTLLTMNEDIRKYRYENKYNDINLLADRLEEIAEFVFFDYPSLRNETFLEAAKKGDIRHLQQSKKDLKDLI